MHCLQAVSSRRWGGVRFGSRIVNSRTVTVATPAAEAFASIQRIGGRTAGTSGTGFGVFVGFSIYWSEEWVCGAAVERPSISAWEMRWTSGVSRRLSPIAFSARAEMKLPGRAWLEFEVTAMQQHSIIRQTAIFDPLGLFGLIYWFALYPLHYLVFAGMLKALAGAVKKDRGSG